MKGYISFYFWVHDSDKWCCGSILFRKAVNSGTVHSYGRNHCAALIVKIKHMRALLFDLQCRQEQKTMIHSTCVWVDNTAAIAVAKGNEFTHETVKHVTVKVRFIQECVQRESPPRDYHDHIHQD